MLLVTAGDNPQRISSEGSRAMLCVIAPIPATSGLITRFCQHDPRTVAYMNRRLTEGKSKRHIIRCLKHWPAVWGTSACGSPCGLREAGRVDPADWMLLWCEGGASMARATTYPPPVDIAVAGGMYVLVDGTIEEWHYTFIDDHKLS